MDSSDRFDLISRIVATNNNKGYDNTLYRHVFYALCDISNIDKKLDDPAVTTTESCIPLLLHIFHSYPLDTLEYIANTLEYFKTLTYSYESVDEDDDFWNTGYDSP